MDSQEIKQGSEEWHKQRLGKATASRFGDMMKNGRVKGTMGLTAQSYMYDLIVERLTDTPQSVFDTKAMEWGHTQEPQARALYCLTKEVRVKKVGFLQHPDFEEVGGSPDGLVEGDSLGPGGVEIKCPFNSRIHLGYLESGGVPEAYKWQIQGLMWITGYKWWDFVSFDPRMRKAGLSLQLYVFRQFRDDEMIEDLSERATRFLEQLNIKLDRLKKL